jgi:hypothetical protein
VLAERDDKVAEAMELICSEYSLYFVDVVCGIPVLTPLVVGSLVMVLSLLFETDDDFVG